MRSLRIKTLVAVTAAVLLVLGATVFLARPILLEGFSRVEDREFNGNIKRIHNRVGNDLEKVKTMATDYARWDDEYKALKERGSAWDTFVKGNLGDGTLSNAKMNALAFIEPSGNIFFGRENTGPDAKEVEIGGKLLDRLKSAEFLARYANLADPKFTTSGIEVWDGHIWLIGAASLTNAETTLPPNGTFI